MQVNGFRIFNAFGKERGQETIVPSWGHVEIHALAVIEHVYKRNVQNSSVEPFQCCAIHRDRPNVHRWFNLQKPIPERQVGDATTPEYGGAMRHAVSLLSGEWRVASLEEEAACRKLDEAATVAERDRREREAAKGMTRLAEQLASSLGLRAEPAAAAAPVLDLEALKAEIRAEVLAELNPAKKPKGGEK